MTNMKISIDDKLSSDELGLTHLDGAKFKSDGDQIVEEGMDAAFRCSCAKCTS